jgi:hypothetical protein
MPKTRQNKTRKTRRGGQKLNTNTLIGGQKLNTNTLIGGNKLNTNTLIGGNKLNIDTFIGGSKRRRKTVKRGGSSLGGIFGGMDSITGTINSYFGTKF